MATSRHLFSTADTEGKSPLTQLSRMIGILGDFPPDFIAKGRSSAQYFNEGGKLKHSEWCQLLANPLPLGRLRKDTDPQLPLNALTWYLLKEDDQRPDHPGLTDDDILIFADFLSKMIRLKPEDRLSASDLLRHEWIRPALIQLIEVMEAAGGDARTV